MNKKNNCVENLERVTQIENKAHYRKTDSYTEMIFEKIIRNRKKYSKRLNKYKKQIITNSENEQLLRRHSEVGKV